MPLSNLVCSVIHYALRCEHAHDFDAWFKSAAAFEEQHARKLVTCPQCNSDHVEKALMAPAVSRTDVQKVASLPNMDEREKLIAAIRQFRDKVLAEADYVGNKFAEEARKIHYGDVEPHGIYGEATREEVKGMIEDGVDFMPLPTLPEDHH